MTAQVQKSAPLTYGLARNAFFNLVGWAWPILISLASLPYIVSGLGDDAYGVFSIVSIVAGYVGLLNGPISTGNVRFMAEAYACQNWHELRRTAVTGVVIVAGLGALGAIIMFLAANALARSVFKLPDALVDSAAMVFRLGAASFFFNGISSALRGILAAMRRYDLINVVSLVVGTLNTVGIVLAIHLGSGLLGAVVAQVLSSALALAAFAAVAWLRLRKLPEAGQKIALDRQLIKPMLSFSALLFATQLASTIGLQIDRTLIGVMLGTSALTLYIVPAKITDKIPGLMSSFSTALYPLSSELLAIGKLDELRRIYIKTARFLMWLSTFLATVLIVLSKDVLLLWMGPKFAASSWLVLVLLAAASIWRAPATVAFQVNNGLGRADVPMWGAFIGAIAFALSTSLLIKPFGIVGAALGMFLSMIPVTIGQDLFTQRVLLRQRNWRVSLGLYARPVLGMIGTVGCAQLILPGIMAGWWWVLLKATLTSILYLTLSILLGALDKQDMRRLAIRLLNWSKVLNR